MDQVLKLLDSYTLLEAGLRDFLDAELEPLEFDKGDFLVRKGSVPRYLGFIEKGLLRGYHLDEKDNEKTSWFMKEGDIYASVLGFFRQIPAVEWVVAIEPTLAHCLPFTKLKYALEKWPSFHLHRAEILQKYYLQSIEREMMRQQRGYAKFCYLMEHYSDLEQRVLDKYLASFLNMQPEHYSTIKKEYFEKHPRR